MTDPVPVRAYDENGLLALRDGLVFVMFLRKAHTEIRETVGELYDVFLELVGESNLQWIHDRGELFRPLTSQKRARLRQRLIVAAPKLEEDLFTIKGGGRESEAAEFLFQYRGRDMKGRLANVNASYIEIWFPTEFPTKLGAAVFVNALLKMAQKVPFSSGYCSLAFNREEWAVVGTDRIVRAKVARHPGLDIHNTMSTAIRIGDDVRGAYWITFLSNQTLERLNFNEVTFSRLARDGIKVHHLANGIAIQAGSEPEPGDVNRGNNLPEIRLVAALIEPIQHVQTVGIFGFESVDDFVKWQRRHLL